MRLLIIIIVVQFFNNRINRIINCRFNKTSVVKNDHMVQTEKVDDVQDRHHI